MNVITLLVLSYPLNLIFAQFFYVADTLQNISDIIDPSFLDVEFFYSIVKIEGEIDAFFDEVYEFAGKYTQRVLVARFGFAWGELGAKNLLFFCLEKAPES